MKRYDIVKDNVYKQLVTEMLEVMKDATESEFYGEWRRALKKYKLL